MKLNTSRKAGFTLVEIMIVVAIIGLLAAIAIPNFVRARKTSQTNACINNLRQIDGAKQQWALELGKSSADLPVDTDIQPFLGRGSLGTLANVHCPLVPSQLNLCAGYTIGVVGTAPLCNSATGPTGDHYAVLQ